MRTRLLLWLLVMCLALAGWGFEKGKRAYTKRYETDLLSEPKPLASAVTKLPFGAEVRILELEGRWARVAGQDAKAGWVYLGNLAEDKPDKDRGIEGLQTEASATTASIAARPLDKVARNYASEKGLNQAAEDIVWLEGTADKLDGEPLLEYLRTKRKGEYQ